MKSVLLILVPVFLLSIFLAGGVESPFPQRVAIPSGEPRVLVGAAPSGDGKQLQINDLRFASPSPRPSPSIQPLASNQPQSSCSPSQKVAVDLLLDVSASMSYPLTNPRISSLYNAATSFINQLKISNPDNIVGIQIYSSPGYTNISNCFGKVGGACPLIPFKKASQVGSFGFNAAGATHMKDGFELATSQIQSALSQYPTSEYKWILIFLSDGIPNQEAYGLDAGPDEIQNPQQTAQALQGIVNGIRIVSIGLDLNTLEPGYIQYGKSLMQSIASAPQTAGQKNYYDTSNDNLSNVFQEIGSSTCQ